ncbi:glycosyltransferase, partial [Luteimonas sp. SDU101]
MPPADRATIALAAGGTGGHLFPAEALARELMARGHAVVIHTERRGAQYAQALAGIEHVVLPASSLEGGIAAKARAALTILRGVLASRRDLRRRRAALMVGFGGYPSFAPALAAKSLGLPLLLHEQATRLSKANAQLLRLADGLATSFPAVAGAQGFDPSRIVQTGNPVRQAILAARGDYPPFDAASPLHLLVVGGSQGAAVFGRVVPPALALLPAAL